MQITLKAARVNAGMTQKEVRETTGIACSTLIRWEDGRIKPKNADLQRLCKLYGVSVEDIKI